MKKYIVFWAASFICLLFGLNAAWAEDAAMVVDVLGPPAVFVNGSKEGRPVMLMDFLECGDQVDLQAGGKIVLNYFSSGAREEINGPGLIEIGLQGSRELEQTSIASSKVDYIPPLASLKSMDGQHAGMVVLAGRKPGPLEQEPVTEAAGVSNWGAMPPADDLSTGSISSPSPDTRRSVEVHFLRLSNTAVKAGPLDFAWQPVEGADRYELTLQDSSGQIFWEGATKNLAYQLTGMNPPLGEEFTWTVKAFSRTKLLAEGAAVFKTLSRDLLTQVTHTETYIRNTYSDESTEGQIALAMLYKKYKLNDDAKTILLGLAEKFPDNENVRMQLQRLENNYTE